MNDADPTKSPTESLGAPVSHLSTDRLCTHCHHNLVGQPVYREPQYGLVVARCPECGAFTPMLEYPTLGRWGRRLGALCAALVLIGLVVFMLASAGILAAWGYGVTQVASQRVSRVAYAELNQIGGPRNWWQDSGVYDEWVANTGGLPGIIERNGGLFRTVDPDAAFPLLGLFLTAVVVGLAVAVLVPAQRGVRLALVGLLPFWISFLYMTPWLSTVLWPSGDFGRYNVYAVAAERHIELPVMLLTWPFVMAPALVLSALLGRRVARLLVRILLPPRHRLAFIYLWSCDGLTMTPAERGALAVGRP